MKKRLAALVTALAILLTGFAVGGKAATSYQQAEIEEDIYALMSQYCGTYWYGNYNGAIQCKGFADMVFAELYGTGAPGPYSDSKYYLPYAEDRSCVCIGILNPGACTGNNLRALLSQALPGDYVQCVRYTGTQHSMIVVNTSLDGITFFDCNLKGSLLCACYTYSWEDVENYLTRGVSLYRHKGYVPSTSYRLIFDANGGTCGLTSKQIAVGEAYGFLPNPEREGYKFDYWYTESFNSSRTPREIPVSAQSVKSGYCDVRLLAHWSELPDECALYGHDWDMTEWKDPTCTDPGYTEYVCKRCGEKRESNYEEALGHNYVMRGSVPATNTEDGSTTYTCTRCKKSYSEVITCVLNRFADLNHDKWYFPYVKEMVAQGLMNGVSQTAFGPDDTLTRAMLVTILYRMQGSPEAAEAGFRDVPAGKWYAPAVNWAKETGVVNGYSADTFGPNDPVTREQAATILYRFASTALKRSTASSSPLGAYLDSGTISGYAVTPLEWANACGILSGYPDKTVRPKGYASRVQIAKMIITMLTNTEVERGVG